MKKISRMVALLLLLVFSWACDNSSGGGGDQVPLTPACSDTIDNDGDTLIDLANDPGCSSASDTSELGTNECDDGIDNDADTFSDFLDPACLGDPAGITETGECQDTLDNDADTTTDFSDDPGCTGFSDTNELGTNECDDGVDNDSDGLVDLEDPGCDDLQDVSEAGDIELIANGNFSSGDLAGWVNESSGPGLVSGLVSFVNDPPQSNALNLDSLAGSNYYMEYAQYIPISSPSDLSTMKLSFKWKQNNIESIWGVSVVELIFFNTTQPAIRGAEELSYTIGKISFVHQTGSFYDPWCTNDAANYCVTNQSGSWFDWTAESVNIPDALALMPGVDVNLIKSVKLRITSYNNAGTGADALWDDISLVWIPACGDGVDNDSDGLVDLEDPGCTDLQDTREAGDVNLVVNGDFSSMDLAGWVNETTGPGWFSAVLSFVNDPPQSNALNLNSLAGNNYYMEYAQYFPVSSVSDLNLFLSFKWKQSSIEATWGVSVVEVLFYNIVGQSPRSGFEDSLILGKISFVHQTGSFYDPWCTNDAANYCVTNQSGSWFDWTAESVNISDALALMPGVDVNLIKSVKLRITSYNNAGTGADALWDDIGLFYIPACDDRSDNDGDTVIDFLDPGCNYDLSGATEIGACQDGIDNDGDTLADYPSDPGCTDEADINERGAIACDDGIDNDGDTTSDYLGDPGCSSVTDPDELGTNECDDDVDNDGDTLKDINDPACFGSPFLFSESEECGDGIDNDGDTNLDYPDDLGCLTADDTSELGIPTLVGFYTNPPNEIRKLFVSGNYAYAMEYDGFNIIDISNPASPTLISFYAATNWAFDVYILGNYAYLTGSWDGLEIVDVSDPANPTRVETYITGSNADAIFVKDTYAYVGDWDTDVFGGANSKLTILDVSDPPNATMVGYYQDPPSNTPSTDIFVSGNYAYLATGSLAIFDVSDPTSPIRVSLFITPATYNYGIYVSGNYVYLAEGNGDWTKIIDVADPYSPYLASYLYPATGYAVTVSGNYAFVADNPAYVFNVGNPYMPILYNSDINSAGLAYDIMIVGSYAYIANWEGGLLIVNLDTSPSGVTECNDFIDNDGDTLKDYFPINGDPGCTSFSDNSE